MLGHATTIGGDCFMLYYEASSGRILGLNSSGYAPQGGYRVDPSLVLAFVRQESRFQPKKKSPTNVDSRKNAISPSTASGTPKISPT